MKYASTKAITKLWEILKAALSDKVETTDSRLSDSRTPKSHASTATTYGVSSGTQYGHAKASSTIPNMNGTASAGEETSSFARGGSCSPYRHYKSIRRNGQRASRDIKDYAG